MNNNDELVMNNIRCLALDMITNAKSGHPGIVLGAAPILYTIYANHLRFSSVDSKWMNRDRFVMSAGHGSALLYAMLHFCGFDLTVDDLKNFRKINSKTPGHPEVGVTPGVDVSTGPLGQGIATAVGLALGERSMKAYMDRNLANQKLLDYYTYVLCGDGDLMEGVSYEACSFAGSQKLNKLIVLYDSNGISLDGKTSITFTEDIKMRFESMGWQYQLVKDGNDMSSINEAINKAKEEKGKPSIIEVKTVIGYASSNAGTNIVHGKPLSLEEINLVKDKLRVEKTPFYINPEAKKYLKDKLLYRLNREYTDWANYYGQIKSSDYLPIINGINLLQKGDLGLNYSDLSFMIDRNQKEELRLSNNKIINAIAKKCPFIIGGSADLSSSCKTFIGEEEVFACTNEDQLARNIFFGVREHAMGAILNGLALSGFRPFGSTFFAFSDYLRPAIRMSALMNLPVTYIFTHDSITVGEDGPTHQPVEQLASLRTIPNLRVYRPCDVVELYGSWVSILQSKRPAVVVVNKGEMPIFANSNVDYVKLGAYAIKKEVSKLDGIIIATGSDVRMATLLVEDLNKTGLDIRVISMPCKELFLTSDSEYKKVLLPRNVKTIVLESGVKDGWQEFATSSEFILSIDTFGSSGSKNDVAKKVGFDYETLKNKIETLFR